MDGWTSPITASFLGIVIIWFQDGKMHRAILEFIRLVLSTSAACVKRFGLEDMVSPLNIKCNLISSSVHV